ncbi:MAG: hypothetical protein QUV05_03040 [Phycisphaerae bacterium]|jgi:hypothetical protein|nr:hypothetical protein [Phycisphaerae bacterium]
MWPFGWWRRFWRRIGLLGDGASIDLAELKELGESSPTKKYVNLLLLEMAKGSIDELTLSRSMPLPRSKLDPNAQIPTFESMVNRLKVLAALDPVIYQHPKEGRIELTIGSDPVAVHVRFVDTGPERSVHLRMEWLESPAG